MKRKIVGILVITLLIGTVLPVMGNFEESESILVDNQFEKIPCLSVIDKHLEDSDSVKYEKSTEHADNFNVEITRPKKSLYINDNNFFGPGSDPFDGIIYSAIVIGPITIEVELENFSDEKVEFYIDDSLKYVDFHEPYTWTWNEKAYFKHTLTCIAYDCSNEEDPYSIQDTQDIIIFSKGSQDIPEYNYDIYQIDYDLDGLVVTNSSFGGVDITFIGTENPQYFNMVVDDVWVIQNIPLIPCEGIGVEQTIFMGFDLGIQDGIEVSEIEVSSSVTDVPKGNGVIEPPDPVNPTRTSSTKVNMGSGRQPGVIEPGNPQNEFGGLVETYTSHQGSFPNQDCEWHECVPTAVSNSLNWLQEKYGQPPVGKDLSIETMKEATGWDNSHSNPDNWGCYEGWADLKRNYMNQNGYEITTTEYPDPDDMDHAATADECKAAMEELRNGQDVELNGLNHCAAIVGMARLKDGRYVIYVSHDTDQEHPGGTRIEKVIYDPNKPNPTAEGGWGFNGKLINGFVVECPSTRLEFAQSDFDIDDGFHKDTPWGDLELEYDSIIDTPFQYLNLKYNNQWIIKNLPLRSNDKMGDRYSINIPFELGVSKGTMITSCEYSFELTSEPLPSSPTGSFSAEIEENLIHISSGIVGQNVTYTNPPTGPTTNPIWFLGANIVDGAFHPWGAIANQDCGNNECAPTAVSNSLKTLKNMHPEDMKDLTDDSDSNTDDTDIGTMKPVTGWTASGCPSSGDLSNADAWWNKKDTWMSNNEKYPIDTEAVDGANALDKVMAAIKNGKDVEMEIPGHVVMVTGIIKLADGTYLLEVAHDSDQDHDAKKDGKDDDGGVEITIVKYDPTKNEFSGPAWIQGKKLTGSGAEKTIFIIESVSKADDVTDPTVVISFPLDNADVGNPINVTGYASDGHEGSGIVELNYKLEWATGFYNGEGSLIDPPDNYVEFILGPIYLEQLIYPGDWITITIFATDAASNTGEDSVTVTWVEEEDITPPVTKKTIGEPNEEGGYMIYPETPIYLDATDDMSGVQYIHFEIWWDSNGDDEVDTKKADETVYSDTIFFTVAEYGVYYNLVELRWYAVDNAENVEYMHYQEHYVMG